MWQRIWFDPATRQTRRASLGTADRAAAERALVGWFSGNAAAGGAVPPAMTLVGAFARYQEQHGCHRIGAQAQRISLGMILRVVPDGMTIAGFSVAAQHAAVRLAAQGYADGSIKRAFGAAQAAIDWAWRNGALDRPVPLLRLPDGPGRERVLSVAELARLWDAAMPAHLRVLLALALAPPAGRRRCC